MTFRPLHDRVVVKRLEGEEKTKGGIIIPDTVKEKPQEGKIIAYPVCCQYDKSVIICRSGLPRLSNNASRFSAGFSRRCRLRCLFGTPALA